VSGIDYACTRLQQAPPTLDHCCNVLGEYGKSRSQPQRELVHGQIANECFPAVEQHADRTGGVTGRPGAPASTTITPVARSTQHVSNPSGMGVISTVTSTSVWLREPTASSLSNGKRSRAAAGTRPCHTECTWPYVVLLFWRIAKRSQRSKAARVLPKRRPDGCAPRPVARGGPTPLEYGVCLNARPGSAAAGSDRGVRDVWPSLPGCRAVSWNGHDPPPGSPLTGLLARDWRRCRLVRLLRGWCFAI